MVEQINRMRVNTSLSYICYLTYTRCIPFWMGYIQAILRRKSSGAVVPEDLQRVELDDCFYLIVPILEGSLDVFRVGNRRD